MSLTGVPAALGGLAVAGAVLVSVSAPQAQVLGPPPTMPPSPVATVKPTPWICGFTCVAPTYLKASNYSAQFGQAVALSRDGKTLAIGAPEESSAGIGVDGAQTPYTRNSSGAVYVFARDGFGWRQQAYIKASNADGYDRFGFSVALSADGNTLAVGAYTESGGAAGVGGDQTDNSVLNSGAVYVFTRSAESPTFSAPVHWTQSAYIKASNPDEHDLFGSAVALSANGATMAVSAPGEDSRATGIDGDEIDDRELSAGAVYVFRAVRGGWAQEAYVKASNTEAGDELGASVALGAAGDVLAVGAGNEDSGARGVNGNQGDDLATGEGSGAAYLFIRANGSWSQMGYFKPTNTERFQWFGGQVSLAGSGHTLAVGAAFESSNAVGVNGTQTSSNARHTGSAYVFYGI
jgi:trimeric autotransporter adhesin